MLTSVPTGPDAGVTVIRRCPVPCRMCFCTGVGEAEGDAASCWTCCAAPVAQPAVMMPTTATVATGGQVLRIVLMPAPAQRLLSVSRVTDLDGSRIPAHTGC